MGWFSKFFRGVPKEEIKIIHLNMQNPYWEIEGPKTFQELFIALQGWLPEGAILLFEESSPDAEITTFSKMYSVQEQFHNTMGIIWPRLVEFHIPATETILAELARIMEHHAEPELAIHFHIYCGNEVFFECYDAFSDPILISDIVPEEKIKILADRLGKNYRKVVE